MDKFKPPWDFFPLHVTTIEPFVVEFVAGFDQGELMSFSVGFYDENGTMSAACLPVADWRLMLPEYLHWIDHARWLAAVEPDGRKRYMRLDEEHAAWKRQYENRHNKQEQWK